MDAQRIQRMVEAAKRVSRGARAYVGTEYSQDGDAQALADAWLVVFEPDNLQDVKVVLGILGKHDSNFRQQCRVAGHPARISNDGLSAWCSYCGDNLGWHCPDSPDGVCHYASEHEDTYELLDGTVREVPVEAHGFRYSGEDCVICGEPEERK